MNGIKIFCVGYYGIKIIWNTIYNELKKRGMKKPLNDVVKDIYDEGRYKQFMDYEKQCRTLSLLQLILEALFTCSMVCSPFFEWVSQFSVYQSLLISIVVFMIWDAALSFIMQYYKTFVIEERFGMNKMTKRKFNHEFLIDLVFSFIMSVTFYFLFTYILENITYWTHAFQLSFYKLMGMILGIGILILCLVFIFVYLSFYVMTKQYTFTSLENTELLDDIHKLLTGCKKKVKSIKVYDESRRSNSKNAFVLKLPFFRMIGIADNFLNENSYNELLGVLAHEAGHLKHKRKWYNYVMYFIILVLILFIVFIFYHFQWIQMSMEYINQSFGFVNNVYYLYFIVIDMLIEPILFLVSVFHNYVSRQEEYEADRNVVQEGYGKDLIALFKKLSRDELVDVNPHPFIEFIEYDHPSITHRILALLN